MPVMPPARPLALLALATLAACNRQAPPPPGPTSTAATAASATTTATGSHASAQATQSSTTGHGVKESTDAYEFSYSWPAAADALPALRAQLAADEAKTRATLLHDAAQGQKEAARDKYPFHPYAHWQEWQVVTDLPGWLSLSSLVGNDSGGAHPNYGYAAILWDKAAGQQRQPLDLFTSPAALAKAIRADFCKALDAQRAKKRGGNASLGSASGFDECIDPLAQTVILGSLRQKGFDRIGFLIAPYEAGPYAEGSYEVTLPVTPAVLAAVKPEWRGAFAAE
ncbi:PdaC/SigV domain-containing protein [Novosphingobium rhizosphaerae]|uniref:PdaC/SigV domain-containing protein n=1 Tax=Novosphingobium rhizosphaerae TaxID=1551649 RepID=UPI0017AE6DEE